MMRMRILRAGVRLRRWKRRPVVAGVLGRVRRGVPFAASAGFNLVLVLLLALGYTSFVAKGIDQGGIGERVVTVSLFDTIPENEPVPEVVADEPDEEIEDASIGADIIPEGNAVEEGEDAGEMEGDEAPEEDVGEQTSVAKIGVEIPQIALPEVDAGEGRPDGVVGVDCYAVFSQDANKALECAGRDILSGWRAEVENLGEDWERFARDLGIGERVIRYGPRNARGELLEGFVRTEQIPVEVQERYALEVERLRRRQLIEEYGRTSETRARNREQTEREQNAATYEPVPTNLPD